MCFGDLTMWNVESYSGKHEKCSSNFVIICYGIGKAYVHIRTVTSSAHVSKSSADIPQAKAKASN